MVKLDCGDEGGKECTHIRNGKVKNLNRLGNWLNTGDWEGVGKEQSHRCSHGSVSGIRVAGGTNS